MTSSAAEPRRYTYGDLMEWDDGKRYELYDGVPEAMSSPTEAHQLVLGELYRQIANFLVGKPCKAYIAPFDVRLFDAAGDRPEDSLYVLQPDLMVVCDHDKVDRRGVRGAPDLVIEILSPSTQANDRLRKFRLYERASVREYWIVDPERRTVQVYTPEEGRYCAAEAYAGGTVPVGVLDGCAIELDMVFA